MCHFELHDHDYANYGSVLHIVFVDRRVGCKHVWAVQTDTAFLEFKRH